MTTKLALKRELGLRDLTLFAVTCIISARWIPIAAHAGPGSVTLWFLAAVLFMVPLTVAVAALVAKYPEAGGLYLWTRRDFGAWAGFLSFWVYWMGIAFLFPTAAVLYIKAGFSMFGPLVARLGDNRSNLLGLLTGCGLLLFVESASFFCSVDLLVSSQSGDANEDGFGSF